MVKVFYRGVVRQSGLLISVMLMALLLSGCSFTEENPDQPWALVPPATQPAEGGTDKQGTTVLNEGSQSSAQGLGEDTVEPPVAKKKVASANIEGIAAGWQDLVKRLEADGVPAAQVRGYFAGLEDYSSAPMAVKIAELHRNAFERKAPSSTPTTPSKTRIYKGIVTQATVDKCNAFLAAHADAFDRMEKAYDIPKEVIVSLLFVETKLGTFMGKEKAFWSLAAMAAADSPERVKDGITHLPITKEKEPWLEKKLHEKSNWAYKELKALITHCALNALDPQSMPGSVYGAIGICQFMPSNLKPYGADGNVDGKIDLFEPADAIHSAASYLTGHGWGNETIEKQHKSIKRYNNLTTYANTILALAESVRSGTLYSAPPEVAVGSTPLVGDEAEAPATAAGSASLSVTGKTVAASKKQ